MNRLNRKVEYALMALKIMTRKQRGEFTSANEIVEETGSPFDATARVLQRMGQCGLLQSEHGAHGGYKLVGNLQSLSMFELTEMILGEQATARCLQANGDCELVSRCNIVHPVSQLNQRFIEFYRNITIADLLNEPAPKISQQGATP